MIKINQKIIIKILLDKNKYYRDSLNKKSEIIKEKENKIINKNKEIKENKLKYNISINYFNNEILIKNIKII